MSGEHNGELTYTTDDDGVWLMCGGWLRRNGCGWEDHLGFHASPEDVAKSWAGHLSAVAEEAK